MGRLIDPTARPSNALMVTCSEVSTYHVVTQDVVPRATTHSQPEAVAPDRNGAPMVDALLSMPRVTGVFAPCIG